MIELKSIVKSEQSSVNILSQFWIESDKMSRQCFWILKFIYQNYTTSTLYYYIAPIQIFKEFNNCFRDILDNVQ